MRRFAAAITRFTRRGALRGARTVPSASSLAFFGGGGGGMNCAPPVLLASCAVALPAATITPRQMHSKSACSDLFARTYRILFRTPAELAVGLALKELARLPW